MSYTYPFSPEGLRNEADRYDRLADAAEAEGDKWDAAECRGKANELRRKARRAETP